MLTCTSHCPQDPSPAADTDQRAAGAAAEAEAVVAASSPETDWTCDTVSATMWFDCPEAATSFVNHDDDDDDDNTSNSNDDDDGKRSENLERRRRLLRGMGCRCIRRNGLSGCSRCTRRTALAAFSTNSFSA